MHTTHTHPISMPSWRGTAARFLAPAGLVLALAMTAVGCASGPPGDLEQAYALYAGGENQLAYDEARRVLRDPVQSHRADEAAYVAGLSAQRLGKFDRAITYLDRASRARDRRTAFDAAVSLGSVYTDTQRYADAADAFHLASELSSGDEQARALFYAAVAEQKLGRWASARTTLLLVKAKAQDVSLRNQALEQLSVTGYTIQAGAYRDRTNASQAAERLAVRAAELNLDGPRLIDGRAPNGASVTLVQVGEFGTLEHAEQNARRLGEPAVVVKLAGVPE
ncbi:MAG: SPOR domain-containing protein [Planctomycetota bacterium]